MRRSHLLLTSAALFAAAIPALQAGTRGLANKGRHQLENVEYWTNQMKSDAAAIQEAAGDPQASLQLQRARLDSLADDINHANRTMDTLKAERASLPYWEQRTIDESMPLLHDVGVRTQTAVNFLRDHPLWLWNLDNRANVTEVSNEVGQLSKELHNELQVGKLEKKAQEVRSELKSTSN